MVVHLCLRFDLCSFEKPANRWQQFLSAYEEKIASHQDSRDEQLHLSYQIFHCIKQVHRGKKLQKDLDIGQVEWKNLTETQKDEVNQLGSGYEVPGKGFVSHVERELTTWKRAREDLNRRHSSPHGKVKGKSKGKVKNTNKA